MRRQIAACFVWTIAALLGAASLAHAQDEAYFKGKTVRLVVGSSAGGGYDTYARLIAPYLAKALATTIVVENQPGAGGLTALERVNRAEPDGTTLMLVHGVAASFAQLFSPAGNRFDLTKMSHLGMVSNASRMWVVGPNVQFKSLAQARAMGRQMIWPAISPLDGIGDGAAFTCAALKLDCKIVMGYPGTSEAALAVVRGEADSIYLSDISAQNFTREGQNHALYSLARTRTPLYPDVPTIYEQNSVDEDGQWLLDYRATIETLGRILIAPPGVSPTRLATLRAAVNAALTDRALIAEGERTKFYISYGDAEETRKATASVINDLTPAQKERIRAIVVRE
jgi:tripartite-type tricarboxylate transporter receptor subunit TctC